MCHSHLLEGSSLPTLVTDVQYRLKLPWWQSPQVHLISQNSECWQHCFLVCVLGHC